MAHQGEDGISYTIQVTISIILILIGLVLLTVWIVLYENRQAYGLPIEWWIWFFLGFGLGLIIIGLIWLIVVLYVYDMKRKKICMELEEEIKVTKKAKEEEVAKETKETTVIGPLVPKETTIRRTTVTRTPISQFS